MGFGSQLRDQLAAREASRKGNEAVAAKNAAIQEHLGKRTVGLSEAKSLGDVAGFQELLQLSGGS